MSEWSNQPMNNVMFFCKCFVQQIQQRMRSPNTLQLITMERRTQRQNKRAEMRHSKRIAPRVLFLLHVVYLGKSICSTCIIDIIHPSERDNMHSSVHVTRVWSPSRVPAGDLALNCREKGPARTKLTVCHIIL
jgi:hypothetical protein